MIKADFHFHSAFSSDSKTPLEEQVKAGIETYGLKIMCVTDHLDIDWYDDPTGLDFQLDLPAYLKEAKRLKEVYKDKVDLRTGIELGIQPHLHQELNDFYNKYSDELDFIIGSTHLVERMDPYYPEYFDRFGENGIKRYLETELESLDVFDKFNCYGHLDYVVRYAVKNGFTYDVDKYMDIYDAILKKILDMGKGIEINTAGFKAGLDFAHPHMKVLKRYKELGGEIITVGSDGHESRHLAYDFNKVPGILEEAGFKYYTVFKNQKPEFLPINE